MNTSRAYIPASFPPIPPKSAFATAAWALAVVTILAQSLLGTSLEVMTYIITATIIGIKVAFVYPRESFTRVHMLSVVAVFCVLPMIVKSILLESVDSYLFVPELTYRVIAIGIIGSSAGLLLFLPIARGRLWIAPPQIAEMKTIALVTFPLGLIGILLRQSSSGLLAVVSPTLVPLAMLGLVCNVLYSVKVKNKVITQSSLLMSICLVSAGILTNSKTMILSVFVAFGLILWTYRSRSRRLFVILGLVTLYLLDAVVGPAVQYSRQYRDDYGPLEVASQTGRAIVGILSGDAEITQAALTAERREDFTYSGNHEFAYISSTTSVLDRFLFVSYVDSLVVGWSGAQDFLGFGFVFDQLSDLAPDILTPGEKNTVASGDYITWNYGMRGFDVKGHPTTPLYSELFIAAGYTPLFLISALMSGLSAVIFERTVGNTFKNPVGLFWISSLLFVIIGGGVATYAYYLVRYVPFILLVTLLCRFIHNPSGIAGTPMGARR